MNSLNCLQHIDLIQKYFFININKNTTVHQLCNSAIKANNMLFVIQSF